MRVKKRSKKDQKKKNIQTKTNVTEGKQQQLTPKKKQRTKKKRKEKKKKLNGEAKEKCKHHECYDNPSSPPSVSKTHTHTHTEAQHLRPRTENDTKYSNPNRNAPPTSVEQATACLPTPSCLLSLLCPHPLPTLLARVALWCNRNPIAHRITRARALSLARSSLSLSPVCLTRFP